MHTTFTINEFRMIPGTPGYFSGKFFGMGDGADELKSGLPSVFEFTPIDHFEASKADKATPLG